MKRGAWLVGFALVATSGCLGSAASDQPTITIAPAKTYQTITGWEATVQAGQEEPGFETFGTLVIERAVDELGINRLRLEIRSGAEHLEDNWSAYRARRIDRKAWRCLRYSTINDNDDPFVINWNGFRFSELDYKMETVVLPLKRRVEIRGERLYLNATYVAFTKQICPGLRYHHEDPEEYAEFVLATYLHLRDKYHLTPDAWNVILEPDNTTFWRGEQIGRAILAAAKRLRQHGFSPRFIAPSCTNMGNSVRYFDEMMRLDGVRAHLEELSYHRYGGVSERNLRAIGERAGKYGVRTSMLEWIGATHEELHRDLKIGQASAWQQYTLGFPTGDNGAQHYIVESPGGREPRVVMGARTAFLRQYFRYVRQGAVRVEAESNDARFDPVAFRNRDGGFVVVVKADAPGKFEIRGLAAGSYGITYTTNSERAVQAGAVTLASGQGVGAQIPGRGVVTVFAK